MPNFNVAADFFLLREKQRNRLEMNVIYFDDFLYTYGRRNCKKRGVLGGRVTVILDGNFLPYAEYEN